MSISDGRQVKLYAAPLVDKGLWPRHYVLWCWTWQQLLHNQGVAMQVKYWQLQTPNSMQRPWKLWPLGQRRLTWMLMSDIPHPQALQAGIESVTLKICGPDWFWVS